MATIAETARELLMSHTQAQWLYVISDTRGRENFSNLINDLYEGENVAYIYNVTENDEGCEVCIKLNRFIKFQLLFIIFYKSIDDSRGKYKRVTVNATGSGFDSDSRV